MSYGSEPEAKKQSKRKRYFSHGPAPLTARGKRRHADRNEKQKKHAASVHVGRDVHVSSITFTPTAGAHRG